MFMPQNRLDVQEEWNKVSNNAVAHAFVDAARRIAGDIEDKSAPISVQLGLHIDIREVQNPSDTIISGLLSMRQRCAAHNQNVNDPSIKPLIDAMKPLAVGAQTSTDVLQILDESQTVTVEDIAKAVKDIELPPEDFERQEPIIILY